LTSGVISSSGTIIPTNGVIYYQLQFLPTNSIPASRLDLGITNWWFGNVSNYAIGTYFCTNNSGAAGSFLKSVSGTVSAFSSSGSTIPPGAAALGYTHVIIDEHPTAADVAPGVTGNYKWFSAAYGQSPAVDLDRYYTTNGMLAMNFSGTNTLQLRSRPSDGTLGALPYLIGSNGFYIEFDVQLSVENTDNWMGVWVEAVEHNVPNNPPSAYYPALFPGDPTNYERWMELDVQESGFGANGMRHVGTVHSATGVSPSYSYVSSPSLGTGTIDMSLPHTFGASYDPIGGQVVWWMDGAVATNMDPAGAPYVPDIAKIQHFYILLSCYSHGAHVPYTMYVSGVRAYVPP
jgi:hypothetical protein